MKPDELPQIPPLDSPLLTIDAVADRLGVSTQTVRRYADSGRLDSVKLGPGDSSPIRIPAHALTTFLAEARARQVERRSTQEHAHADHPEEAHR